MNEMMQRLFEWCKEQKESNEKSIEMMRTGKMRLLASSGLGNELKDVTEQSIRDAERIVAEMDEILTIYGISK